ncbi:MAG: lamin tail domain-containing protein [Chloroflexota bacterium]|nr:lamin tail domain-containing protein [Chloroflexota bacterium]
MIERPASARRRNIVPQIIFLCLTFAAAASGTFFALQLLSDDAEELDVPQIITVEIVITATPLPPKLVTAAPAGVQRTQVQLPLSIAEEAATEAAATIDPVELGARQVELSTPTLSSASGPPQPQHCIYHAVLSGDTPYGVALRYGADFQELLDANDLTLETSLNLQIGDILIVPLEGCLEEVSDSPAAGSQVAEAPAVEATSTPVNAQFEIVAVEGLGDITAEAIRLRNIGERVNMSNWSLSDEDGNSFIFPVTLLFPQGEVVIYTRSGTSTADARFWGKDASIWQAGEALTLSDETGRALLTLRLPANDGE